MEVFGRDNEARALVNNVRAGHNTLVIAESGLGKTGLIQWIFPLLEEEGKAVWVDRSGPTFTTTLEEIYEHFEKFGWVDIDWSDYCKAYRTNDQKARGISEIFAKHEGTILVFDDCNTVARAVGGELQCDCLYRADISAEKGSPKVLEAIR